MSTNLTKREWFDEIEFTYWLLDRCPDRATEIKDALYTYIAEFEYDWFNSLSKETALLCLKRGSLKGAYHNYDLPDLVEKYGSVLVDLKVTYLNSIFSDVELDNLIEEYMHGTR